jgi:hypothetical protein
MYQVSFSDIANDLAPADTLLSALTPYLNSLSTDMQAGNVAAYITQMQNFMSTIETGPGNAALQELESKGENVNTLFFKILQDATPQDAQLQGIVGPNGQTYSFQDFYIYYNDNPNSTAFFRLSGSNVPVTPAQVFSMLMNGQINFQPTSNQSIENQAQYIPSPWTI